ncbi:aldehyde dehydrogenase family protein [Acinetobacter johnsonii]|uniref:aldehyde dehydrogenase family protein n=1 Tax=Acinetobacter TaxID=469 RepID=UPI001320BB4F|nr:MULTISPECIES: aldehyde dehydrogenase family protein [Acinetobacter]MWC18542.1 aldehyde dehydrogenase family protein [Acinetobacter johnsonii]NAR64587.1 aldehyde dehydrogenase family protein [Acinetobacter haemolyticus]
MNGKFKDFLPELALYAGNKALNVEHTFQDINPCDESLIANIPKASVDDLNQIVAGAKQAFHRPDWKDITPLQRENLIRCFADAIEKDSARLANLESLDAGKPFTITQAVDIPAVVAWLKYYAGWASKIMGTAGSLSNVAGSFHAYSRREPIGVVAAITPWNFPSVLSMWKIAPALAAGCCIVLKPASDTPLTALRLAEIAREVGFPEGVFNVVTGNSEIGNALATHPDIAKVAFTGSTQTGRSILQASVADFKRVTLELGGKSPVILHKDADLDKAIPSIAMGCFFNTGQVCYAGTRLYVHEEIYDEVLDRLATFTKNLKIGASDDPATQLGPVVNARQQQSIAAFLAEAEQQGIEALDLSTIDLPSQGFYVRPAILKHVPADAKIMKEEVFGPVLATAAYHDLDEAIQLSNDSVYGLAAHLWTRDLAIAHQVSAELEAGTVFVNCALLADPNFPFGGFKQSGIGRENGQEVLDAYLESKSVIMALN